MDHFVNSFEIDVPSVTAERFRIDPQPPREDPWQVLDEYEYQAQYKLGDQAHRYAENGTWYLLSVDPDGSKSRIRLNDNTVLVREDPIELQEANDRHCEIISQTLRDQLEWFLTTQQDYWETGNTQKFYELDPSDTVDGYSAYHGFKTKISYDDGFYLTVDPAVKFVSKHPVSYYLRKFDKKAVEEKLLDRYCTLMSSDRPRVKLLSIADDLTVSDKTIENDDEKLSVIEYLESDNKYTDQKVDEINSDDPLARIRFGWMDDSESSDTAPSLLYPNPANLTDEMSDYSNRTADQRWAETRDFVEQINYLRVGGEYCDVSDKPRRKDIGVFEYPELEFGGGESFSIGDTNRVERNQTVSHSNWNYVVKDYLGEWGAASRPRGAPVIDVLHPEGRRDTALEIYEMIREYVGEYIGMPMQENPGTVAHDNRQKLREWIQRHGTTSDGVLVVLESHSDHYLDIIKELDGLPSQGIQVGTFRSALRSDREFDAEMFTTAVGLATKIGVRPYLLRRGLNADVTIGMSVAGDETNTAAAVLISGESGDLVYQTESNFATGSSTATRKDVARRIAKESIADASDRGEIDDPDSIVIHKNGQYGDNEIAGIESGIEELREERYLTGRCEWCAIELSDSSEYRIYSDDRQDCNAYTGSYAVLDSDHALVSTYGVPNIHQGSPKPIHCSVEETTGSIGMKDVVSDLFALTFLNWGFPLVRMKQPLTIYLPREMHDILATGSRLRYPPF